MASRRRRSQLEVARATNARRPPQIGSSEHLITLENSIKVLRIGDCIRVLCDDGVVVAEKVSQTQFKLIQYQAMSEVVH